MCNVKSLFGCCFVLSMFTGSVVAADWDPNDDTFDPEVKSVITGNRTWIGDPSPFVYVALSRTGYTHVNSAHFSGFEPSINLSLMVPLEAGDPKPPAGGMLMMNQDQAQKLISAFRKLQNARSTEKNNPIQIKTLLKDSVWSLVSVDGDDKQRGLQLENKGKDKTDKYRFSINASKKLVGAIEHSLKSLKTKTEQ